MFFMEQASALSEFFIWVCYVDFGVYGVSHGVNCHLLGLVPTWWIWFSAIQEYGWDPDNSFLQISASQNLLG